MRMGIAQKEEDYGNQIFTILRTLEIDVNIEFTSFPEALINYGN